MTRIELIEAGRPEDEQAHAKQIVNTRDLKLDSCVRWIQCNCPMDGKVCPFGTKRLGMFSLCHMPVYQEQK